MGEAQIRADVLARQLGLCARDGELITGAWSCHHRRLKSGGGSDLPANRIAVCGSGTTGCHGWIHANVKSARQEFGWIVSRYHDPAKAPVFIKGMGWVLLDDDYGMKPWQEGVTDDDSRG